MQPRSSPFSVSVTKVAPACPSQACVAPGDEGAQVDPADHRAEYHRNGRCERGQDEAVHNRALRDVVLEQDELVVREREPLPEVEAPRLRQRHRDQRRIGQNDRDDERQNGEAEHGPELGGALDAREEAGLQAYLDARGVLLDTSLYEAIALAVSLPGYQWF